MCSFSGNEGLDGWKNIAMKIVTIRDGVDIKNISLSSRVLESRYFRAMETKRSSILFLESCVCNIASLNLWHALSKKPVPVSRKVPSSRLCRSKMMFREPFLPVIRC